MWKVVILLTCLCGSTLATPVVGLKKNMEIVMADEIKNEDMSKEKMSSSERAEIAMTTLNLPSNATSIRADIVDGFSCKNREYGYYADIENDCQIFHVCMPVVYADGRENTFRWSFICPEETVFSQDSFTCMREEDMSFGCEESVKFYELNRNFGIIDSSMEMHSNEAEMTSDIGMGDTNMEESMLERKPENQQKTMINEEKIVEKIQKRVDEIKPEISKPLKSHKKKNSLRKSPTRKVTTTTVMPPTAATEQVTPSTTPTTSLPLEVEITTAKLVEKLTTKYQRFTRRPETNKDNKKKVEQISKQSEPVTVGAIKESSKKPLKTESVQKRKRPHVPSSLKHKFNGEEKPLKTILKTSEIIKIAPNQEQSVPNKINSKKDFVRPPIPEPILLKIEEQPAQTPQPLQPLKPLQNEQTTENQKPLLPIEINATPVPAKPTLPVPPIIEEEQMKKNKPVDTATESTITNEESKNEEIIQKPLKNKENVINDLLITSLNAPKPTHAIDLKIENIPSQEPIKAIEEEKNELPEKVEGSLPSEKGELLDEHKENEEQHKINNKDNKEELNLNENKQDDVSGSFVSNNQPIDQQSMIINLISSLVNAENSKVDDSADKNENSQFTVISGLQQQTGEEQNVQPPIMDTEELPDQQQEKQQLNSNQLLELTTSNIVSTDNQAQDNDQKIENSEHDLSTSTNKEDDNLKENKNSNKKTELNQFDAMQKFIHQQHELYNHMTHIPVKLLTDDQFEDYKTKGDLSNPDALNVIQRIEQLLQDEVKDENLQQETDSTAPPNENMLNEPLKQIVELKDPKKDESKTSSEIQQSSEEIRPIYHRIFDPVNANLLKDSSMSVDENKPLIKEAVEPLKSDAPVIDSTTNLLKSDVSESENIKHENSNSVPTSDTVKSELLESKLENEESLNSEPLKLETLESKPKEEEIKVHNKIESINSAIVKEDSVTNNNLNDNKLNSSPPDTSELEKNIEKSPSEELIEMKKLDEPTASEQASDIIRTSSRSLKFKTRITDPRKRRFLFKADA